MADTKISALTNYTTPQAADVLPIVDVASGVTKKIPFSSFSSGTGSVTTVGVQSANGFGGSVANPTTTPSISITSSVTGVLKGNGTAVSAATGADLPVMTATVGGAVPTPPNDTTKFLRGDGTFAVPPGSGTVTTVSVTTQNGVSGSVTNPTTTPAIALTLGAITPTSVVPSTPIAVANGGTGATTAANARINLEVTKPFFATVGSADADFITDGTADDVQINQALASVPSGGTVLIQDGTYDIQAPIFVTDYQRITGEGIGTILKTHSGYTGDVIIKGSTASNKAWVKAASTTATITSTAHGLLTNDRIWVSVSSNTGEIAIKPFTITKVDADTFTINSGVSSSNSGTLSYVYQVNESETCRYVHIAELKIDGSANSTTGRGIYLYIPQQCMVENCWITGCKEEAIFFNGGNTKIGWYNLIQGNTIDACNDAFHFRFCEFNKVTHNTVSGMGRYGGYSESDSDTYDTNSFDLITSFVIYCPFGNGTYKIINNSFARMSTHGIVVRGVPDVQIIGNTFDTIPANSTAIVNGQFGSETGNRWVVVGNATTNVNGSGVTSGSVGISEVSASDSCIYAHNSLTKVATAISQFATSTNVFRSGNAGDVLSTTYKPVRNYVPVVDNTSSGPACGDFNCGYTSSAIGDLVYLDSSSTWQKCDANTLALYNGLLGIALEVKASGAALLVALPGSFVYASAAFPTFTIGSPIYMSETAGAVTQTAPTTTDSATRVIGWAIHADKMYFNPSPDYITHT